MPGSICVRSAIATWMQPAQSGASRSPLCSPLCRREIRGIGSGRMLPALPASARGNVSCRFRRFWYGISIGWCFSRRPFSFGTTRPRAPRVRRRGKRVGEAATDARKHLVDSKCDKPVSTAAPKRTPEQTLIDAWKTARTGPSGSNDETTKEKALWNKARMLPCDNRVHRKCPVWVCACARPLD